MKIAVAGIVAVLVAASIFAATPELVVDIRTRPDEELSSNPRYLGVGVGDAVLFVATSYLYGGGVPEEIRSLWRTDGTEDGTYPLIRLETSRPPVTGWVASDGMVFVGVIEPDGARIWRTDGTIAGTVSVTDRTLAVQRPVATFGDRLVYLSDSRELRVLGPSGDQQLGVVRQGQEQWTSTAVNSSEVFVGTEEGLWRSDGSSSGTRKVAAIPSFHLTFAGERLVFAGADESGGEVWSSDGTSTGTRRLADLSPGPPSTFAENTSRFASLGSTVIFLGTNGEIGATDGTIGGTRLILKGIASRNASDIAVMGGSAYFQFDESGSGGALWRSDGTTDGTRLVSFRTRGILPAPIAASRSRVWFVGVTALGWHQLWLSNGTDAGTRTVLDRDLGWGVDRSFATSGDRLFFSDATTGPAHQPWVSDGTAMGTRRVATIAGAVAGSSSPREQATTRDGLYFLAKNDEEILELWRVGADGPRRIMNARRILGATPDHVFVLAGTDLWSVAGDQPALLAKYVATGNADPWSLVIGTRLIVETEPRLVTDGTVEGTSFGMEVWPGRSVTLAGRHFMTLGPRLWWFDDQSDRMRLVASTGGPEPQKTSGTAVFRDSLLMFTHVPSDDDGHWELWRASGEPGDVQRIASLEGRDVVVAQGAQLKDHYYFAVRRYHPDPHELWRTDGTAEGTSRVALLTAGAIFRLWSAPTVVGDRIVFDLEEDWEVMTPWVTDGTEAGTMRLSTASRYGTYSEESFVSDGRIAYFLAWDRDHGRELWRTDGTPAGTVVEAEVLPGPANPNAQVLKRVGDDLYFAASTAETGRELWSYRAPLAPTVSVDDVRTVEGTDRIFVPVRLDRPASERVAVRYTTIDGTAKAGRDYTTTAGELVFVPGEMEKRVELAIGNDTTSGPLRAFLVRLESNDLPLRKRDGVVLVEDDDRRADLALSIRPDLTVTNAGPSNAEAEVCVASLDFGIQCEAVSVRSGGTAKGARQTRNDFGPSGARITGRDPDPDPANNVITWVSAPHGLLVTPAAPRVGEPLTIFIETGGGDLERKEYLTCSNPEVLQCPPFITIPAFAESASVTLVPTRPGEVQIRAGGVAEIRVAGTAETRRIMPTLGFSGDTYWRAGAMNRLLIHLGGVTADGESPTGTITIHEEGRPDRLIPVIDGTAELIESNPAPDGLRNLTVIYSGDARFFDRSGSHQTWVGLGSPVWEIRRLTGTASFEVHLHAEAGAAPTGTVTWEGDREHEFISLVPVSPSASRALITPRAGLREIQVRYSGDARFAAETRNVVLTTDRRRGVRR